MAETGIPLEEAYRRWREQVLEPALARSPEREASFTTVSSAPVERVYTPLHLVQEDGAPAPADAGETAQRLLQHYTDNIAHPGEYPFTRGIHPTRSEEHTSELQSREK